jgi:hypothetical protein
MSNQRCWFVYILASCGRSYAGDGAGEYVGAIKIGISRDPDARRNAIQTASPYEVQVAYRRAFPDEPTARRVERRVHQQLASHRLRGEWFDLKVSEIIDEIEAVGLEQVT